MKKYEDNKEKFKSSTFYDLKKSPGLNPDSREMVEYINASENWQDIQKVIGNFHKIIHDPSRSIGEKIDAQGYFAICQFKILAYLSAGNENQRQAKLKDLEAKKIFTQYFGIVSKDVNYKAVFDKTREYNDNLRKECLGKEDYPHQSALNAVLAGLIRLPIYDLSLTKDQQKEALSHSCSQYAKAHLESAKRTAYLGQEAGNGRGHINLKSAYKNFCSKPSYSAALGETISSKDSIYLQKLSVETAVKLGYKYAHIELGNYAKKQGDLKNAQENYTIAAQAGYIKAIEALELITTKELNSEAKTQEKPSNIFVKKQAEKMIQASKEKTQEI